MTVLGAVDRFARQISADLLVLTVEPTHVGKPAGSGTGHAGRVQHPHPVAVHDTLGHENEVRRGEGAEQTLAAVDERRPDVVMLDL